MYYYADGRGEAVTDAFPLYNNPDMADVYYGRDLNSVALELRVFSNGLAPVVTSEYKDGSDGYEYSVFTYGYIDKTGRMVVPDRFALRGGEPLQPFDANGRAIVYGPDAGTDMALIDREGREIIPYDAGASSIVASDGAYAVYTHYVTADGVRESTRIFDKDGNETRLFDGVASGLGDGWFAVRDFSDTERRHMTLIDDKGDVRAEIPPLRGDGAPYDVSRLENGNFIVRFDGRIPFALLDGSGEVYYECVREDGYTGYYYDTYTSGGNIKVHIYSEGNYADVSYFLVTPAGEEIFPPSSGFRVLNQFGEMFAVRYGYYGGLVMGDGEWIVKVSMLDYLDD
jgi:hypothetical protein